MRETNRTREDRLASAPRHPERRLHRDSVQHAQKLEVAHPAGLEPRFQGTVIHESWGPLAEDDVAGDDDAAALVAA